MCFVKSSTPEPEPIQKPATLQDTQVQAARSDQQKKVRAAAGARSTILTRAGSDQSAPATGKTLLGQ